MVGGLEYASSQFNRATQALRQPGSAFKPLVYLAGLEAGLNPESMLIDAPVTIEGWSPKNYDERYRGKVSGTVLAVLSVLVTGLFLTYNFYLSAQLPASEGAPRVGQKAPDFTLPDTEGNQIALSALVAELGEQETAQDNKKRGLLLVFYRGYW